MFFYAAQSIVLHINFINLIRPPFLKFRIVIGLIVDLNFTAKRKAVDQKHKSRLGAQKRRRARDTKKQAKSCKDELEKISNSVGADKIYTKNFTE